MSKDETTDLTDLKLYTTGEVAELFKVGEPTVRRWIAEGSLDAFKVNGRYRIKHKALVAFSDQAFKDLA